MIPAEMLCNVHNKEPITPPKGQMMHALDVIRRTECECDMDVLWLWYDLIGFEHDLLDENEENHLQTV